MKPIRKVSLVFGLFFAGTFIFSIPALIFYNPLFNNKDYIFLGGFDIRISMGAFFEIMLAICNIATAIVIFPIFKRVNETVSLGYVAVRIVESVMILAGVICLMSVMTFRADFLPGNDTQELYFIRRLFLVFHDWTFLLGPQFCAGFGNGILLGYLMYRSGVIPTRMALLGLIGGPLAFIGGILVLFGVLEQMSTGLFALTSIEIIWELSITIYAIFKGFKPSPLVDLEVKQALSIDR
jgi:hypothetical protein